MKLFLSVALCAFALFGCTNQETERKALAAQQAATRAQEAEALATQFNTAYTAQNWNLAQAHGTALLQQYPDSKAAQQIKPQYEEAKHKADTARETRRLARLWSYNQVLIGKGAQVSASIMSREPLDTDGSGKQHPVQLVFRDHPEWKRSAYLVIKAGDFPCLKGCTVNISTDGNKPKAMRAWRPDTDEAIAIFIEDHKTLWNMAANSKTLQIKFPIKSGLTQTAEFETSGLDTEQMPGWD